MAIHQTSHLPGSSNTNNSDTTNTADPLPKPSPDQLPEQEDQPKNTRIEWNFSVPPLDIQQTKIILLLTIGGIGIHGRWCGHLGQHFSAWAPPQ